MYANSEAEFAANGAKLAGPFGKLEEALAQRGNNGPFFNGPNLSLVDAAYAPFLQRYTFMDHLRPLGVIEKFPRLVAWCHALLDAPAVRASTVPNIEDVWQENLILQKRWLAKFVSPSVIGAAAA
jgi:glutathione S-transferase